ncbi:hypothetical protein [Hymenobacter sp. GOD-10R]|uniref:hypothetical protein n=1 Tax=Hymenobacter sp. GOD-10R TaxID=3093922 RepID=UPI002D79EE33|nr:hypothetical protein [Hymenobacter sp. GOD-10R]WRQ27625.1 hypothetical protein SD425_21375 [Hymenobacter sp. GOD-10R]
MPWEDYQRAASSTWLLWGLLASTASAQPTPTYTKTAKALPAPAALFPEPIDLRLGIGTTYDNEGQYRCTRITLELAPVVSKHLGTAIRLASVLGKPSSPLEKQVPNQNYKAAYLEQESIYYPLGTGKRMLLGIGAGGFVGYYKKNTYSYLKAMGGKLYDYGLASRTGLHAGFLGSVSLDVALGTAQR